MLSRLAGADLQIHIQHQRFTGGRHQQAAHHFKGGRFPRAVRPEQAKNLAAFHREIDVISGGKIPEFFGQGFRFDHRFARRALNRVQDRTQRRFRRARPAQQVDKRIFKARRGLFHFNLRHSLSVTDIVGGGLFFEDHPHRTALNHPVAHLRQFQHPLQQPAVGLLRAVQQKAAPGHALRQFCWFTLIEQLAFVHQQHVAALFRFVEVGGAPEDQHPVARQLVHHLPQLAAGNRVHAHAGLIQQQNFRLAHERTGQPQLLLHPAGELACQPVGKRAKRRKRQQTGKGFLPRFTGDAAQVGIQIQVFHHRQVFIQPKLLRHIAEHGVERTVIFNRIEAQHAGRAFIRLKQPREHAH